jgi:hypothetical protein
MRKVTGKIAKTAVRKSEKERQQEAKMKAQDRGTGPTPAAGAKARATQGTFTTSDAIPWQPVDPENHPGLMMFTVWGNPNEGPSLILQKYPAGMDSGWHWHTAALVIAFLGVLKLMGNPRVAEEMSKLGVGRTIYTR